MRKLLIAAALAASTLGLGASGVHSATLPGGIEGCIVTAPGANVSAAPAGTGNLLNNARCSYKATRKGGYVAAGDNWKITVSRMVNGVKKTTATYYATRSNGPGKGCQTSVIKPGDIVDIVVANGVVAVGAPTPPQTDPYAPANLACPL